MVIGSPQATHYLTSVLEHQPTKRDGSWIVLHENFLRQPGMWHLTTRRLHHQTKVGFYQSSLCCPSGNVHTMSPFDPISIRFFYARGGALSVLHDND